MKLKVPTASRPILPHPLDQSGAQPPIEMIHGERAMFPGSPQLEPADPLETAVVGTGLSESEYFSKLAEYQRHVVLPPGAQAFFDSKRGAK